MKKPEILAGKCLIKFSLLDSVQLRVVEGLNIMI